MRFEGSLAVALVMFACSAFAVEVSTVEALNAALEAATPEPEIIVTPGDYRLTKTLVIPANVTLRSRDGKTSTFILQQDGVAQQTFRCVQLSAATSVIDGFTFKEIAFTSAANVGCVIYTAVGGTIKNCDVIKCVNYSGYGVIATTAGTTAITGCELYDNTSVSGGSCGIYCNGGTLNASYCIAAGGRPAAPITGNSVAPGFYLGGGAGTISHCTVVDGFSTTSGYGIGNNNRSFTVKDSIVLSSCLESAARGNNGVSDSTKKLKFQHCLGLSLNGWNDSSTDNIITWDPQFVNPLLRDYHLKAGSPCIGAASDGGDIGCFAYDAGYVSPVPVVNVAAGADLAAAIAAAPEGAEVRLAEGTYTVPSQIDITRALRIVGAGRGKTVVKSDGTAHRMFRLYNFRAALESMTISDALGTNVIGLAVYLDEGGGLVRDCRITGCKSVYTSQICTSTLSLSTFGVIQDAVVDGNSISYDHVSSGTLISEECGSGAAGVAIYKGSTGEYSAKGRGPYLYRTLIAHNHGTAFFGNNSAAMTANLSIGCCTITDNDFGFGLSTSRQVSITDSIVQGGYEVPARDATLFSVTDSSSVGSTLYNRLSGGTTNACIVSNDPKFVDPIAGDYHLTADSPARGIAAGGTDAGCFQYDSAYEPEDTTVNVPAGSDLTAAVAAAKDGATLKLAAGTHYVTTAIKIARPLRIVGADRDTTFVESALSLAPCTLFTLKSGLADIRELTVRKVTGRAFLLNDGGRIERCRVTDSVIDSSFSGDGVGVYCNYGHVYRCQFDNLSYDANRNQSFCDIRNNKFGTSSPALAFGYMDDCLVTKCKGRNGSTQKGYAVYIDRDGVDVGGSVRNCTVFGNDVYRSLSASSYAAQIRNCIFTGTIGVGLTDANKLTRMSNNCLPQDMGTACVVAVDPCLRANGAPKPSSPVIGQAQPLAYAASACDLAGNPRLRKDGTQDIGCLQYMPSGLILMLR